MDICEHQQAEAELQLLKGILDNAQVGYWSWNISDQTGYMSPTFKRMLGYGEDELANIGESWQNLLFPEDLAGYCEYFIQNIANNSQSISSQEFRYRHKNGSEVWCICSSRIIEWDRDGQPLKFAGCNINISKRKQAEERLSKSQAHLSAAMRVARLGSIELNIQTKEIWWSREANELIGRKPEQETTTDFDEFLQYIHPEDRDYFIQKNQNLFIDRYQDVEFRSLHPDGTIKHILMRVEALYDHQNQPLGFVASLLDITSQKQVDAELLELSSLQTAILNASGYSITSTNQDGIIKTFNTSAERLSGYTAEEVIGTKPPAIFCDPEQIQQKAAALSAKLGREIPANTNFFAAVTEELGIYEDEWISFRKDGSCFPMLLLVTQMCNAKGEFIGLVGIAKDISEQKKAEEELTRSRDLQEAIFNESADALFLVAPQTVLILECNRRAVELFEAPDKSALIGINGSTLQREPFSQEELAAINFELETQGFWSREIEYRTFRENRFWGNIAAKPIVIAGCTLHLIRVTDITARKLSETQLKLTNEKLARTNLALAQATRLKDEFLANMSHELRTPLNAILGMSEGLQDNVFGTLNSKQAIAIATIEESGKHLLELINDILDLSKIESGKLELQFSLVEVHNLCNSSLMFVQQMAFKKNIYLCTSISKVAGNFYGDERRLRQVFINLLSNAIKFTPEGGTVKLKVWISAQKTTPPSSEIEISQQIYFSVIDTGIGIAQEDINKLFKPFVQLDSNLNRQYSGTGLGLALVKRIVDLHGGTVTIKSELGQGSCFTVCLPSRCSQIPDSSPVEFKSQLANSCNTKTQMLQPPLILVAEDNQANIETMSDYLELRGYRLKLARNGREAVEFALAEPPDIILMDIQMPIMDGLEAMHRIREHTHLQSIPIIALTALAMVSDRNNCLAAGANEYLTKPVKLKQLVATIQQLLAEVE